MERTARTRPRQQEPDEEAVPAPAAPVLPAQAGTPGEQVIALQRTAGNAAVSGLVARREAAAQDPGHEGIGGFLTLAATAVGVRSVDLQGSVGRGGRNEPGDVQEVRARFMGLGMNPGAAPEDLERVIADYQRDVVGLKRPDGRIDPGGRTLGALVQQRATPAPAAERQEEGDAPEAAAGAGPGAGAAPAPAPAEPAAKAGGPAPALTGALKDLVAAAGNQTVDEAAAKLAGMQERFAKMKHGKDFNLKNDAGEELGEERDRHVQDIEDLRAMVAGFSTLGLPPEQVKALQTGFYRALNTVTPFYYQNNNVIWEASKGRDKELGIKRAKDALYFKTCNITSLSMALEGLGKTAADYEHLELIGQIAALFSNEFENYAGDVTQTVSDADYTGLRLPEFVAMAVILHSVDYKVASRAQLLAAVRKGPEEILKIAVLRDVAKRFGVTAENGGSQWAAALNEYGLEDLGGKRRRSSLVDAGGAGAGVIDDGEIEGKVPLQAYKKKVMKVLGTALDSGKQVVVSQANHYVKLQSIDDRHVVKDDPGGYMGADEKLSWEEARAVGLFRHWILLS